MSRKKLIDLYAYRLKNSSVEFLLLKRSSDMIYKNQWRMIGGKVEEDETYWQAALRELNEETGLLPVTYWTIPSVNTFYEHKTDQIHTIPAFAAEIDLNAKIVLDDEHSDAKWFSVEKAVAHIRWPEQKRLLNLTNQIIISNQILDDWLVTIT